MKAFRRVAAAAALVAAWTLSVASFAASLPPVEDIRKRTSELTWLIGNLHREALTSLDYAQLFTACTQVPAPAPLTLSRADDFQLTRALIEHIAQQPLSTSAELDAWVKACANRALRAAGPRNQIYATNAAERQGLNARFGVGLALTRFGGEWIVREAREKLPAAVAGISPGDVLLRIDGSEIANLDRADMEDLLLGAVASKLTLEWRSATEKGRLVSRTMTREVDVPEAAVDVARADGHVYVRLAEFRRDLPVFFMFKMSRIDLQPRTDKVLDLRGNRGGDLSVAFWFAAALAKTAPPPGWAPVKLKAGLEAKAFSTEQALQLPGGSSRLVTPNWLQLWSEGNWVVLVDGETGAAAAWLAGILREQNGATLVGNPVGGGGVDVERNWPSLDVFKGVRYEVGKFVLPSGKVLDSDVVNPDVPVTFGLNSIRPYPRNADQWKADPLYGPAATALKPKH